MTALPTRPGGPTSGIRALAVAGLLAAGLAVGEPADAAPAGNDRKSAAAAEGVRYLYLVRHGHYDRVDSLDDRTENGLSALGREQARLLGARLAALPTTLARFVSSDFRRAVETADEIGAVLGRRAERDTLLEECSSFSSRPGFDAEHDPAELSACQEAMEAAWAKYATPAGERDVHDLLVCHGNVIRWFVSRAQGNDTRNWTSLDIGHASLTVIAVRPDGGTRLVIYSDVGHLPVEKQSWAGRGAGWGAARK